MLFLQPLMLWGLLAASIPVVIHLLNRRRHKTVKWAAMQFLLKATRESRGKKKLRHIIILICRTLAVATLILAAAIPVVGGFFGLGVGKPELIVVVLDRSATMETVPATGGIARRELALQRIRDALADFAGTRVVLIDSASASPQDVPSPEVLPDLSSAAATDTAADFPKLLEATSNFLLTTPGRAEVWIASDLQESNWRPDDGRWENIRATLSALPRPPRLRILSLAGPESGNRQVAINSSRRNGNLLELDVEITRGDNSTNALSLPVTIRLNGAASTEPVTLTGQQLRFRKTLRLPENSETGFGWIALPGDGNPRDNVSFFAYGPARPVRSLIVGASGETASYLSLAAAPGGYGGQSATEAVPVGMIDTHDISAIFWAAPLPEGPAAESVTRFLEDGGQVVFVAPEADSPTRFLDMAWEVIGQAPQDQFFILDSWDHGDGLLRDGIDGTAVPAERLRAIKRRVPLGEAAILARWDDGQPALVRRVVGRGTAWFLGSRPDYSWSNLGDADVLLPIAQRAVLAGSERFDAGMHTEVGSTESMPVGESVRERLDTYATDDRANPVHLAGVFRIGNRTLAVNRPANEDLAGTIDEAALGTMLEGTDFSLFEDQRASTREQLGRGIWRAFLLIMLLALFVEALLCLPAAQKARKTAVSHP